MAEALGIAVLKLTQSILKYGLSAAGGGEEARKLLMEITATRGYFETLKDSLEGMNQHTLTLVGRDDGPVSTVHKALEELDMRLQKMITATGLSKVKNVMMWPLDVKKTQDLTHLMERQKSLLGFALQRDHIALSTAMQRDASESRRILESVQSGVESMAIKVDALGKEFDESRHERLKAWLSTLTPEASHASMKRQEGTGDWFLASVEYKDWISCKNRIFYCSGIAGAGKSYLASLVIDNIRAEHVQAETVGLAWIYNKYDSRKQEQQNPANSLGSILSQLLTKDKYSRLLQALFDLYTRSEVKGTKLEVDECLKQIQHVCLQYDKVYIVLDAIDEFSNDPDEREKTIGLMRQLPDNVQLMITSRPIPGVESALQDAIHLKIEAQHSDIKKYVSGRLQRDKPFTHHIEADPTLHDRILKKLVGTSQGLFLLPKLQMDALKVKARRTKFELIKGLEALPLELDKTYSDAFERIAAQDPTDFALAQSILSWMCLAIEPLTSVQMQHAIAIEGGMLRSEEDRLLTPEYITTICAGLITCDNHLFRFVHYTTAEYFQRTWKTHLPRGDFLLASICLTHINKIYTLDYGEHIKCFMGPAWNPHSGKFSGKSTGKFSGKFSGKFFGRYQFSTSHQGRVVNSHRTFPLLLYCAKHLIAHLRFHFKETLNPELIEFTRTLWNNAEQRLALRHTCAWGTKWDADGWGAHVSDNPYVVDLYPPLDDLEFAAYFHLSSQISELLFRRVNTIGKNASSRQFLDSVDSSLCIAAYFGFNQIIELLLESGRGLHGGMVVNFTSGPRRDVAYPLAPSRHGGEGPLFISHVREVQQGQNAWTAVQWAVLKNHLSALELLLRWNVGKVRTHVWPSNLDKQSRTEAVKLLAEYGYSV